jgi:hypothetical protein
MKTFAAIGTCPLCGQGRLIIARDNALGDLYVLCEECESEWDSPEQATSIGAATHDVHGRSTFLDRDELGGHPWQRFLWK